MNAKKIVDAVFGAVIVVMTILAVLPLLGVLAAVMLNGFAALVEGGLSFITTANALVPPTAESVRGYGVASALLGSMFSSLLSLAISVPVALALASLSLEYPNMLISKAVDVVVRSFSGIPTIVVSMVFFALLVVPMRSFSLLAGSLALAVVSLPYAYTYLESALKSIPVEYREAAASIGLTKPAALIKIYLGIARKLVAAGILMTFARAMGETAAVLFTLGGAVARTTVPTSITSPADSISLLVFDYAQWPYESWIKMAWGASLLLFMIYLAAFILVRIAVKEVRM